MQLTYTTVLGKEEISKKGLYLIKSIQIFDKQRHRIFVFFPKEERKKITYETLSKLEKLEKERSIELIYGKTPLKHYPQSCKAKIMEIAGKEYSDPIVLLDADMLIVGNIRDALEEKYDLFLKPVDIGGQFWCSDIAKTIWSKLGKPSFKVKSTVDKKVIIPFWNAGFVLTKDPKFGKVWLKFMKKVRNSISKPIRFLDQVSLSLVSELYSVKVLDERYNYPLQLRFSCPEEVKVIHYHNFEELAKLKHSPLAKKLEKIDVKEAKGFILAFTKTFLRRIYFSFFGIKSP